MFVLWCFVSNLKSLLKSLEPYLNSIHWWKLQLQNIQYSQILANLQKYSNRIRALCLEEGTQRWHSVPLQSQVKPDGGKRNTTGIWQRIDKKLSSYTFVMLLVMMRSTFENRNWHLWRLEMDSNGNSYVLCVLMLVRLVWLMWVFTVFSFSFSFSFSFFFFFFFCFFFFFIFFFFRHLVLLVLLHFSWYCCCCCWFVVVVVVVVVVVGGGGGGVVVVVVVVVVNLQGYSLSSTSEHGRRAHCLYAETSTAWAQHLHQKHKQSPKWSQWTSKCMHRKMHERKPIAFM